MHIRVSASSAPRLALSGSTTLLRLQIRYSDRTFAGSWSRVIAVFQKCSKQEKAKEEPAWSAEAMNACWTAGWKRPEVTGAIEKVLEENKAKFDHLADTEKTAHGINDFFIKIVTSAVRPILARR